MYVDIQSYMNNHMYVRIYTVYVWMNARIYTYVDINIYICIRTLDVMERNALGGAAIQAFPQVEGVLGVPVGVLVVHAVGLRRGSVGVGEPRERTIHIDIHALSIYIYIYI